MRGMNELMRQAQVMQRKMEETQEKLKEMNVEAQSGGGMVTVVANGGQEIVSIKLDPAAVDPEDVDMLQDLVIAATNEALKKAKELNESELGKITGGMKMPGLF